MVQARYAIQRRSAPASGPAAVDAVQPTSTSVASSAPPVYGDLDEPFSLHLGPVQRAAEAAGQDDPAAVHAHAAAGVSGPASALPFADQIQRSFGPDHDISGINAHVGGPAATAAAGMGATAYATGNDIAFGSAPDLHTAAHEAAHVVQQRAGVHLKGGVGQAGDPYETHADAVADLVVAGQPAGNLLRVGPAGATAGAAGATIQRKARDHEGGTGLAPGGPLDLSTSAATDQAAIALHKAASEARALELRARNAGALPLLATMMGSTVRAGAGAARQLAALVQPVLAIIPQSNPDDHERESWRRDLNKLARSAFAVMRRLGIDGGGAQVAAALTELGTAAAPLSWQLPESTEEAVDIATNDQPCETDVLLHLDARDENPAQCHYSHEERDKLREDAAIAAGAIKAKATAAIQKHQGAITQDMADDQKFAAMITELFIEALFTAATGGLGKGAGAGKAVAEITTEATKSALRTIMTKIATDTTRTLVKKARFVQNVSMADESRVNTLAFADDLNDATSHQMRDLIDGLPNLGDEDLHVLEKRLQHAARDQNTGTVLAARLGHIIHAFQDQIAPAGQSEIKRATLLTDPEGVIMPRKITKRIARVITTIPGPPAFALVEVEEDVAPTLRKAGRAATATIAAIGKMGTPENPSEPDAAARRQAVAGWIDAPHVEIRFLRWIDSPDGADFEGLVAADAPAIPAGRVLHLPFSTPHGTPAR